MTNTLSLPDNLDQRLAELQNARKGEYEFENGATFSGEEACSRASTAFIP